MLQVFTPKEVTQRMISSCHVLKKYKKLHLHFKHVYRELIFQEKWTEITFPLIEMKEYTSACKNKLPNKKKES